MNLGLTSHFADRLIKFLAQKQALGYSYKGSISDMRTFDKMCAERFPNETELTEEICNAWATRRGAESNKNLLRRLPLIREFARYLLSIGEKAFILPQSSIKPGSAFVPHIFSHSEIAMLWAELDCFKATKAYPAAHLVLPTLIRLLYCCGLRPSEAFNLRINNVNLEMGKLYISESKGHKDRIVMLADDVRQFCWDYDKKIRACVPNRVFFFANHQDKPIDDRWVRWVFGRVMTVLKIKNNSNQSPRLYDLRHSFATHRLYQWMHDNKDLYAMLPYLSTYMGHSSISQTFYYIHLVPGMFETMSGFKHESVADIFPKVVTVDE